jgi:hypothetical protein
MDKSRPESLSKVTVTAAFPCLLTRLAFKQPLVPVILNLPFSSLFPLFSFLPYTRILFSPSPSSFESSRQTSTPFLSLLPEFSPRWLVYLLPPLSRFVISRAQYCVLRTRSPNGARPHFDLGIHLPFTTSSHNKEAHPSPASLDSSPP